MEAPLRIFFTGRYSYRQRGAVFAGLIGCAFGGAALLNLYLGIRRETEWSIKAFGAAVFVGGIGGMLALAGITLLWQWITRRSLTLEISSAGIKYGKTFHPWNEIHWVSGHLEQERVRLFYQKRGLAGFDRHIPVDQNPIVEEYKQLMAKLRDALSQKYPDLDFG
jgi:hypothetical protein